MNVRLGCERRVHEKASSGCNRRDLLLPMAGAVDNMILAQNATSYNDATVVSSTTYQFMVRAYNADACADSAPVSLAVPVILLAPSNVKASAVKGAISLTWTDTNSAETGYDVLRGTTPDGNFSVLVSL